MSKIEDYAWMALGLQDPGYADTQPIVMRSRVNPWSPGEHQLSYRARRPGVGDRVRMLVMRPGKNGRDDEQDQRRNAEHRNHLRTLKLPRAE